MAIAEYLSSHPKIKSVFYPGLTFHPEHDLAKQLFNPGAGFGGMMAFEVRCFLNSNFCRTPVVTFSRKVGIFLGGGGGAGRFEK